MKSANRHALIVTLALLAIAGLGCLAASANAARVRAIIVMEAPEAVQSVKATGGHVQSCTRTGYQHFRCEANYWFERHEAEVEEDGTLINEVVVYVRRPAVCEVGTRGVRVTYLPVD